MSCRKYRSERLSVGGERRLGRSTGGEEGVGKEAGREDREVGESAVWG